MRAPSRTTSSRLAAAFATFALLTASAALAPFASAAPLSVSLPTLTVLPGATIDVPITTSSPAGLGILSVDYRLNFAANVVQSASAQHDGWIQTLGAPFVTTTSTFVDVSAPGFTTTTSTSTLLQTVRFVISASAPIGTDMPLTLSPMQCNEGSPAVQITNGLLRVRAGADAPPFAAGTFALAAAAPDPAQSRTRLAFSLPRAAAVRLVITGIDGRRVRILIDGIRASGAQNVEWDLRDSQGRAVAPGVYLVTLVSGDASATRRLVVLH